MLVDEDGSQPITVRDPAVCSLAHACGAQQPSRALCVKRSHIAGRPFCASSIHCTVSHTRIDGRLSGHERLPLDLIALSDGICNVRLSAEEAVVQLCGDGADSAD